MAHINTTKGKFYYRPITLYDGMKPMNKDIAIRNLKEVIDFLNIRGIKAHPLSGTMLGMVREHDFIEWDEDIDFFILKEDEEKWKDALWDLKEIGFELVRYYRRGLYSIMREGEYIDFYVMYKVANDIRTTSESFMFEKYITDTITIDFKGVKVEIPRDYDEYLTFLYGDWRTPVQFSNYEKSWWQRKKLVAKLWLTNHLPDRLYYPLLKKRHQTNLDKFKAKCKTKGIKLPAEFSLDEYTNNDE